MNFTLVFSIAIVVLIGMYFAKIYLSRFKMIGEKNPLIYTGEDVSKKWQIYYFYNPHCGACKSMTPIINEYQEKYEHVVTVDISTEVETAQRFHIKATPTSVLIENGVITDVELGLKSLLSVKNFIERYES